MPEVFFIGHSVGIVLAKARYGNRLVLYQNSTVGKNHGDAPSLGEGVVMYPNTRDHRPLRDRFGHGHRPGHERRQPQHARATACVFQGAAGGLVFKPPTRAVLDDLFR